MTALNRAKCVMRQLLPPAARSISFVNAKRDSSEWKAQFRASIEDPASFWLDKAKRIEWFEKPPATTCLTTDSNNIHRWFKGGKLNQSYLCLDFHIKQGRGHQTALIWDSPVTKSKAMYTFQQLRDEVSKLAGILKNKFNIVKGDRVIIYMPMTPHGIIAMLACARIGAVHSVVFGGFAAKELAFRIDDSSSRLVISASCGVEGDKVLAYKPLLDSAIEMCQHPPKHCIVFQRPQCEAKMQAGRDYDWCELMRSKDAQPVDPVPMDALDPLYILYTSGTTGKPKGVVRDNSGAVALKYTMDTVMNAKAGSVYWAASDIGWVVGHSFIVYGPLIQGCTTVVYEGKPVKTPDAGAFWRVVSEHRVNSMFCAPTAFRAIKKEDASGSYKQKYDLSSLKAVFLAGERLDPPTFEWLTSLLRGIDIVDNWWQTETGTPIVANPIGIEKFKPKSGSATKPMPGYDVQILDDEGKQVPPNTTGSVVIKLPLPPGNFFTLWGNHERMIAGYLKRFPGYYLTGDGGLIDSDGYVHIMGRIDDVINVAGHRLSTGEMEEVVGSHPAVAECCVVAIEDQMKGEIPVAFVVIKDTVKTEAKVVEKEVVQMIRDQIGAVASLKTVCVLQRLPKTRSGKILRGTIKQLAVHAPDKVPVPSTIDDPTALQEIVAALKSHKVGPRYEK